MVFKWAAFQPKPVVKDEWRVEAVLGQHVACGRWTVAAQAHARSRTCESGTAHRGTLGRARRGAGTSHTHLRGWGRFTRCVPV